jgi:hypothetical protein
MTSIIDNKGVEQVQAADIAEVFAQFFETLYQGDRSAVELASVSRKLAPVTRDEVRVQLRLMKLGKAPDHTGIVAEMLKSGIAVLLRTLAEIFTAVLDHQNAIPEYWKISAIRVLFKKGDERLSESYRPICSIPILYKLFSRILCNRIRDTLTLHQSPDQAGFQSSYSCDDHLFAILLLTEK